MLVLQLKLQSLNSEPVNHPYACLVHSIYLRWISSSDIKNPEKFVHSIFQPRHFLTLRTSTSKLLVLFPGTHGTIRGLHETLL